MTKKFQSIGKHLTVGVLVAIGLAFAQPAQGEEKAATPPLPDSLGWLVGTWEDAGAAKAGADRTKMTFRWAADKQVLLWEGSFVAKEATWSFVATFFHDRHKGRTRVFSFNNDGQRHLGLLSHAGPGRLVWKMSGVRPDGKLESFVMEFVHTQNDYLTFSLSERRPGDPGGSDNSSVTLRRAAIPKQEGK